MRQREIEDRDFLVTVMIEVTGYTEIKFETDVRKDVRVVKFTFFFGISFSLFYRFSKILHVDVRNYQHLI